MSRKKCFLCSILMKDGSPEDPHFRTAGHRRREKSFRRSFGAELARKLQKLMKRWSKPRR